MQSHPFVNFWTKLPAGLAETFVRFPLPVLLAALLTVYNLDRLPQLFDNEPDVLALCLNMAGWMGFVWMTAVQLWGEAFRRPAAAIALQAAGLAFFLWLWDVLPVAWLDGAGRQSYADNVLPEVIGPRLLNSGLAFSGLMLAIGIAPYLARRADGEAVWQFNHKLWVGFAAAWFGGLVFYLGALGINSTIETLFEVDIPAIHLERAAVLAYSLAPVLLWLTLIPRDFHEPAKTGGDMEFTSRAVALLVKFIFVPLIFIFAAILLAYSAKVLIEGGFSEARLGQIGVIYSTCVIITALLAYPTRASGPFLRVFWAVWPYLLIAPVILLIAALWVRLDHYGVTPARYLPALAAVWFTVLTAAFILTRSTADVRLIPGLLAVLLMLASFGPWGAASTTAASQFAILEAVLTKQGIVRGGRVQPAAGAANWPDVERARAASALEQVLTYSGLARVRPWFEGTANGPSGGETAYKDRVKEIAARLELPRTDYGSPSWERSDLVAFRAAEPMVFKIDGGQWLAGPFFFFAGESEGETALAAPLDRYKIRQESGHVIIRMENGGTAKFDLRALARAVPRKALDTEPSGVVSLPFMAAKSEGDLPLRLAVVALNGEFKSGPGSAGPSFNLSFLQAYVLVEASPR